MTAICYVGIEISANFQKFLLGTELVMLVVLSVVALVKVARVPLRRAISCRRGRGSTPSGARSPRSLTVSRSCCSSTGLGHVGLGERRDRRQARGPGRAAVISTVVLLVIYEFVVVSTQSYAGLGTKASGSVTRPRGDVLSVLAGRSSAPPGSAACSPTCCWSWSLARGCVDADDHPAHRPHHLSMAVHRPCRRDLPIFIVGSWYRRFRPSPWGPSR